MRFKSGSLLLTTVLVLMVLGPATGLADVYILNLSNDALGVANPGPYGVITTTLNGGAIDVDVTTYAGFGLFGDFGFNTTVTPGVTLNVDVTNAAAIAENWADFSGVAAGSKNLDGFGNFEFDVTGDNGTSSAITNLQFTISRTSGVFTSASQLNELSTGGVSSYFVTHITLLSPLCATAGAPTTCVTGFAGTTTVVPEPGTIAIFGSGLLLMGAWIRRRRKSS